MSSALQYGHRYIVMNRRSLHLRIHVHLSGHVLVVLDGGQQHGNLQGRRLLVISRATLMLRTSTVGHLRYWIQDVFKNSSKLTIGLIILVYQGFWLCKILDILVPINTNKCTKCNKFISSMGLYLKLWWFSRELRFPDYLVHIMSLAR